MGIMIFPLGSILAFWPVWSWYLARMTDGSDEPWGVLALFVAIAFIALRYKNSKDDLRFKKVKDQTFPLLLAAIGLVIYGFSFFYLPALLRAIIAVSVLAFIVQTLFIKQFELSIFALLILSLPIISSLQFYGGYPLRVISSYLSAEIISLLGYNTVAEGTILHWAGEVFSIDAPCSGIKMLWTGLFANFTIAAYLKLSSIKTVFSYWLACIIIFLANLLRVVCLFFTESKIVILPEYFHELIGLFTFVLALLLITNMQLKLRRVV